MWTEGNNMKMIPQALLILAALMSTSALAADLVRQNNQRTTDIRPKAGQVQVVNVWATWCAPCRREMPILSHWASQQNALPRAKRAALVGVAIDEATNVAQFLRQTPVYYPIVRYTGNDSVAWMKDLGNRVGALPFTVVRMGGCRYQQALTGEITGEKLNQAVANVRAQCRSA